MAGWKLDPAYAALGDDFGSLEMVFALEGERLTRDTVSEVIRLERDGVRYYVKRYWEAGKGVRRFFGKPRIKGEWQNLKRFAKWGVPTAPIVAYGLERKRGGRFVRGALITREVIGSEDLASLALRRDDRLRDRRWVAQVSAQLAAATRALHAHHFAHNDLKWRNLLVDDQVRLFLIDCPAGSFWWGPFLRHRIIKDLACLDKVAKYHLSRTQRLRFYLQYAGVRHIAENDKAAIREIVGYFEGRE